MGQMAGTGTILTYALYTFNRSAERYGNGLEAICRGRALRRKISQLLRLAALAVAGISDRPLRGDLERSRRHLPKHHSCGTDRFLLLCQAGDHTPRFNRHAPA